MPLVNSKFLQGVLPDCEYKPSYTIKGIPLARYQGLNYVCICMFLFWRWFWGSKVKVAVTSQNTFVALWTRCLRNPSREFFLLSNLVQTLTQRLTDQISVVKGHGHRDLIWQGISLWGQWPIFWGFQGRQWVSRPRLSPFGSSVFKVQLVYFITWFNK